MLNAFQANDSAPSSRLSMEACGRKRIISSCLEEIDLLATRHTLAPVFAAVLLAGLEGQARQTPATPASTTYSLLAVTNGMQLKTPDGRVVFDYLTSKPPDVPLTSPSVACFHPLLTPTGERVTALAPDDHPHHRGMYLAWHDSEFRQPISTEKRTPTSPLYGWNITKADFWGWGVYAPRDGRVIQNASVKLASA